MTTYKKETDAMFKNMDKNGNTKSKGQNFVDINGNKYTDYSEKNTMEMIKSHDTAQILFMVEPEYLTEQNGSNADPNVLELYPADENWENEEAGCTEYFITGRMNILTSVENGNRDRTEFLELESGIWYDAKYDKILIVTEDPSPEGNEGFYGTKECIDILSEDDIEKTEEELNEEGFTSHEYYVIKVIDRDILIGKLKLLSNMQFIF